MSTWAQTRQMPDVERIEFDGRADWLEKRRAGIGGSDIGAICGLSTFRSPLDVWLDKRGQADETDVTEAMQWGLKLEDLIAKEYFDRRWPCDEHIEQVKALLCRKNKPHHMASLDRLIVVKGGKNKVLECKTANAFTLKSWESEIPPAYMTQIQWYLYVTGLDSAVLAVLIGGQNYREFEIERNQAMIDNLVIIADKFWATLDMDILPAEWLDGSAATTKAINAMFDRPQENRATLSGADVEELVKTYDQAKATEAAAAKEKDRCANQLKAMLGNEYDSADIYLTTEDSPRKLSWKTVTSKRLDQKRIKAELPVIAEEYTIETTSRRFSL